MISLKGITWNHPRGYAPLRACSVFENISVEWDVRSLKDFGDASLSALAANYDLLVIDHPHCGEASRGPLMPFDQIIDSAELARVATDEPTSSYLSYFLDSRQWALPIDAACQVGSFRPDLIDRASLPDTWDAFFLLAERLRKREQWAVMALCPTDALCSFLTLCAQGGDPPSETQWIQKDTAVSVIEKLKLIHSYCHPESLNLNPIGIYEGMSKRDDWVYCPLAFGYADYARPETQASRLSFAYIPEKKGSLLGGAGIGVSSKCSHPEEAMRYAVYLSSPAVQSGAYVENFGQPAHPHAWEDTRCNQMTGDFFSGTYATIKQAYTRPRLSGWPEFQEMVGETMHACLQDGMSSSQASEQLEAEHRRLMCS
jgi:multiple sugar transport system substrate-binding protein